MKPKPPFYPPNPLDGLDTSQFKDPTDRKSLKNSLAYKKYVEPALKREAEFKRSSREHWWRENWVNLVTLIVAILTLIATIWFGLNPKEQIPQQEREQHVESFQGTPNT